MLASCPSGIKAANWFRPVAAFSVQAVIKLKAAVRTKTLKRRLPSANEKGHSVFIMKRILTFFFLIASFFSHGFTAHAAGMPQGDFKQLRRADQIKIITIIDPQTVQLSDGRIMKFSGIEFPDYNAEAPGPYSLIAMRILKDMVRGKDVQLYVTRKDGAGRSNRMGQMLAQVERRGDHAWVQGLLLALGLARVRTQAVNPEMADQMLALEQNARKDKIGLWSNPAYGVIKPEQAGERIGSVQIVAGKIMSVSLKNNRVFLNFGSDWREDFTVTIAPESKRLFTRGGIDLLQLGGRAVRVRGWLQPRNGPSMEIDHPEAMEILS